MHVTKFSLAMLAGFLAALAPIGAREVVPLDLDWKFLQGDAPQAMQYQFDDSQWETVRLPHDWSIAGPFAETNKTGGAGAFLPGDVAWYRKKFPLNADALERRVFVEFDGVMQNSDVWINGKHLGHRPCGYVSFRYELPKNALAFGPGTTNVLTVCADTSAQPASRWYAGAGIYRHARLVITDPVHISGDGVFVTTPRISLNETTVQISTLVTNETSAPCEISLQTSLLAPGEEPVGSIESTRSLGAHASVTLEQQIVFARPKLWDLDTPNLYHAISKLRAGSVVVDEQTTPFGIRDAHFEAATGFWLNGKNFKLKGVCLHADGGAFGAAVPLAIWEDRLKTLRALGVNAVRTAHNPPAPEFLDLCDRMGVLVMDEFFDCWTVGKNPQDYHLFFDEWSQRDEHDTILRDRNHPSIIIYSVGNEIHDTPQAEKARKILSGLVAVAHAADPTRPVTQALFRPNVSHDYDNGLADLLDVIGTNYRDNELLAAQRDKPARKILGTEQRHDRQTWLWLRDNPSHAGQFLWTGVDYLGEARRWPTIGAGSGLLDRTGAIKPMGRERQSWWSDKPMVYLARRMGASTNAPADPGFAPLERRQVLFPDWTPENEKPHTENVEVYSNCKEVELYLNGKSLGKKLINADASPRNWQVPFAPGRLRAVGREPGMRYGVTNELRTAGKPVRITLAVDTRELAAGWDDVAIVRAQVVDAHGIVVPRANNWISFKISGPGIIAAVDNADNTSHEPFQSDRRHVFQGECAAYVKAADVSAKNTATVMAITASSVGLKDDSVIIRAVSGEAR